MSNKQNIFKSLTCLFFCFVVVFITSIFVSETYYNQIINDQIQEISLLKSIRYQDWALMKQQSTIVHKFKPYSYDSKGQAVIVNQTSQYKYTYEFKNVSFSQGNTGNIIYLNTWKREPIVNEQESTNDDKKINVFNVDAQKVYNYDYFAPDTRRFALTYNILTNMFKENTLSYFYCSYMFEYFFKNQTMVQKRIFDPLGITSDKGKQIYQNALFGFNSPALIAQWLNLGEDIKKKTHYFSQLYKNIKQNLGLSQENIQYIAGQKSTLQGMILAIKGVLKYKLKDIDNSYCSGDFCTDDQLIASQISMGFLTRETIFANIKIDKMFSDLNATLFDVVQYSQFCSQRTDLVCATGTNAMNFFAKGYFANYSEVDYFYKNLDKPSAIEAKYELTEEGNGKSMIQYLNHLYFNVFNSPSLKISSRAEIQTELNNNQESAQLKVKEQAQLNKNINVEAFKRSFTNYNHIQPILQRFRDLLFVQLHARAFFNKFINTNPQPKCEDYFSGDFAQYKSACQKIPLNTTGGMKSLRVYFKAFLGVSIEQLKSITQMNQSVLNQFLNNEAASLFSLQAQKLALDLSKQYDCSSFACSSQQILLKQWKDGSVLKNLPKDYFITSQQSILNWDQYNVLKGTQPQLYKFVTVSKQLNVSLILDDVFGIYSIFNLMKVYNDPDGSVYKQISNSDLLYYIQSLVLNIDFNGIYLQKSQNQFFNGYKSQIIEQKRQMNSLLGGAPWLDAQVSIIKLESIPTKFNSINSGIYDSGKLRKLSLIQNNLYSSSQYVSFRSEYEDVSITYLSNKKIKGTNLFGFQTKIQQYDSIEGYFEMIYQAQPLSYKESTTWKSLDGQEIDAFKFQFEKTQQFEVSVEELSNRTVQLNSDSYFIVEPETGLTLQMYVKYTVYSHPFYFTYLQKGKAEKVPLYQGQIYYVNDNTDKIAQINKNKNTLGVLFILGIVLSSISIIGFVIMLVFYKRSSKSSDKLHDEKKSMLSSQVSGIAD